jgi:YD repeat-containing protein
MKTTASITALSIMALLALQPLFGQNRYTLPQVTPKSPNAASLGKYGDIPVSLGNGMANVSVPLVSVKTGGLSLSVALSYHNNGLKVDEIPGWAGLGWDITGAGGTINYEQRGNPDFDEGMTGLFTSPTARQKLGRYLRNQMTPAEKYSYLEEVIDGATVDAQYDLYHYNFMGHSGSFYFDSLQRIVQVPKGNLGIVYQNGGFAITDEAGNRYLFDRAEQGSMGPSPATGMETRKSFTGTASFLLGSIVTPAGRTVTFNYAPYPAGPAMMTYYKQGHQLVFYPIPAFPECPGGSNYNQYGTVITAKNHLLQSIVFDGGSILFETGATGREDIQKLTGSAAQALPRLAKVKLLDAAGNLVDEYALQHSCFGNNDRLRLDAVLHNGAGGSGPERWDFAYHGGDEPAFPTFFSKGKDHWGFYNGAANSANAIPQADYAAFIPAWRSDLNGYVAANRNANPETAKWGLLQKITYPTGGQTTLHYEGNRVVFPSYQYINPFLFKAVEASINYEELVGADTDYGPSVQTGSFTLTGSGNIPVKINAFKVVEPANFINGVVTLSAQPNGPDLLGLFTLQPNTPNQYVDKTIYLSPGTYYYGIYKNVDSEFNATGGRARLSVQAPSVTGPQAVTMAVGGLRVAQVHSSDGLGNTVMKRYTYNDSLGQVYFHAPYYISKTNIQRSRPFVGGAFLCQDCGQETKIHDESVVPMPGAAITYGQVTEYADSSGANGKTEHTFSLPVNLSLNGTQPYISPFMATWRSGLSLQKTIYKKEGGAFVPLRQEQNGYQASDPQQLTWGVKADYWTHCEEQGINNRVISETQENYQTEDFYLAGTTVNEYDTTGTIANTTANVYGSARHTLPTQTQKGGSNGEITIGRTQYSLDYDTVACSGAGAQGIRQLQRSHILAPVEQLYTKTVGGQQYVLGGTLMLYKTNAPVLDRVLELSLADPLPLGQFAVSAINASGQLTYDSRYKERAFFAAYDMYQNVLEERYAGHKPQSYVWDYSGQYLTAQCTNSARADVAATSFEADGKGYFTFSGTPVADADAPTGSKVYPLASGGIAKTVDAGKQYTVSFWAKGSATVSGGSLYRTGKTLKGYTYYEYAVANTASVAIGGNAMVDELRLYPQDAQMVSYTYRPLVGITSQSDANGLITYYTYDAFGRLHLIKDMDGNVLKVMRYGFRKGVGD